MRKNSGIVRNKSSLLTEAKNKIQRKKSRFQSINKNDQSFQTSTPNSTSDQGIIMASSTFMDNQSLSCKTVYEKAKKKLTEVAEIRTNLISAEKKMSNLSKARLTSFKQKQYEKYDENISKLASEATNLLVEADKCMKQMGRIQTNNEADRKLIQNMSQSLASQIRQTSRSLRQQQKQYFDTIRSYQKTTKNSAIQLSQQQRQIIGLQQQMTQEKNDLQNNKVDELVKNINKLSTIYKQLNNLVIEQGSLIDRIDVNIQSTLTHTKQAVVHLEAADQHASSALADRVMKILVVMILVLAVVVGFKWAA